MRIGIRTKFLILISILLFVIFAGITYIQIQSSSKALRQSLFDQSRSYATLATEPIGNVFAVYKNSGTFKIDQQLKEFSSLNDSITNIAVIDVAGSIVYSNNDKVDKSIGVEDASSFEPVFKYGENGVLKTIVYPYFEASGSHRYSIIYNISDDEIEKAVKQEATQLIYFGLLSMLATMGLIYVLIIRFIIRPIRIVSEQAGVISEGNLGQQIVVKGHDEIASLGESVNKMAESLKASIAELKEVDKVKSEFMMITSHNLRTPLTIISGYLDNMELVMHDKNKLMNAIKRIGLSVKRLEVFADDVLNISRFELGDSKVKDEFVELAGFMKNIYKEFLPTAENKKLIVKNDIQEGNYKVNISMPYLRSSLWNLLDNAAKFTPEEGEINISTKVIDNHVEIQVSDNGIGITKEEIPKLFTKFHRGTSTLVYDFEGTGIGLYSSKVMIEKHGGTIKVNSEENKGSTFTIVLPLAK